MKPVSVLAAGAISAFGTGADAVALGSPGEPPLSALRPDPEFSGKLRAPLAARARVSGACDRAATLLEQAAIDLAGELDRVLPDWRKLRIALAIGTSGGGMPSLEQALALRASGERVTRELARAALYGGPLAALGAPFGAGAPCVSVLAACSSSTFAIGLGCRWLEAGRADLVIAGGYDALSLFIASGFEALGTITASLPRPFRLERDGMALGEGAALLALSYEDGEKRGLGSVLGFASTSDAHHVTAPDPSGRGLARAATLALGDAGVTAPEVELVSAHATATLHNDSAEAAALDTLFRGASVEPVLHAYKAAIGHSLGASGALETLAALSALERGILPASAGEGALEPRLPVRVLARHAAGSARRCLKLSAAFGGANAALVLGRAGTQARGSTRAQRAVRLLARSVPVLAPEPELIAARTALPELYRTRLDRASALALTAAALLVTPGEPFDADTTAVVIGTSAASLEADELFDARRRERGAAAVEPRRFPATSPNLPAGQCSLALGLRGPALAVGGGPGGALDALLVAFDLVERGDAERALVIACDDVGPVTRELFAAAELPEPADGAQAFLIGAGGAGESALLERESFEAWGVRARPAAGSSAASGWKALDALLSRNVGATSG
jgi:3-oxoacyl-[acyl-carrier-protein] synthase-1/3-oxoacyl-[acyl-carrier-protein] synthase II